MFGTGNRFKVATIAGIPIYVSASWFFVVALFAFALYSDYATRVEAGEAGKLTAVVVILFFGGILLHEGAHAFAARRFGLPVRAITMVFWGGATETRSWRRGALADFVVAAAGPATTATLGILFLALTTAMQRGELRDAVAYLAGINLFFAAFNAIPGFPLDGGRMLMAIAWGITRKRGTALRVAGVGSMLVGAGLLVYAVLTFGRGDGLAIFLGYIGFVIISVGRRIPQQAQLREQLARGTARDAMRPIAETIPSNLQLYDATERWLRPFPSRRFPVSDGARVVGTISLDDAADTAAARPVREAMVAVEDPTILDADEPLDDVVEWLGSRDGLVVDAAGRTVGMISVADVDRWLSGHWGTGQWVDTVEAVPPRPDR